MKGYTAAVIAMLEKHGYYFLRQGKGAHVVYSNGHRSQVVSRNMPSRQMANAIMKQAGINHKF